MKNWMGTGSAALSFVLWGMLPLYYQFMPEINMWELLSHRVLWSVVLLGGLLLLLGQRVPWGPARRSPAARPRAAGGPRDVHQLVHVHLVPDHGPGAGHQPRLLHDPLFNIAFAVLFLKEKLTPQKHLAVALALAGLAYMLFSYGQLPWFSLVMGPTSPSTASLRRR